MHKTPRNTGRAGTSPSTSHRRAGCIAGFPVESVSPVPQTGSSVALKICHHLHDADSKKGKLDLTVLEWNAYDADQNTRLSNLYVSMIQQLGVETAAFGASTGTLTGMAAA